MELTLEQVISILLKNIIFIIISSIIFLAGAYVISNYFIDPTYISSVKMYVVPGDSGDSHVRPNINDLTYAQKVVNTYIEILKTNSFLNKIAVETKLGYTAEDLKNMVSFKVLNNTEIFQIDVTSESPTYAKFIADSISLNAPLQITGIKEDDSVKLVQPAELPTVPASPNIILNTVIGCMLGLSISVLISILKEILDVRVKGNDDLNNKYDIPILGSVPSFSLENNKKGGRGRK
jgi:capsular polysaccharide biosynthesis protein